jgi:hypothetical protein
MRMTQEKQILSAQFLAAFGREAGAPCRLLDAQDAVAWQLNGVHCLLSLSFHAWPCDEMPACPRIISIRIYYGTKPLEPDASQFLGIESAVAASEGCMQSAKNHEPALQWYVSADQLHDFATWLVLWMRMKTGDLRRIPAPPHAIYIWEPGLRESTYAWTVSAYHAYHTWLEREPTDISNALQISPPPWSILPCGAEERAWGAFMTAWWKTHGRQWVTAGQLRDLAIREGLLAHILGEQGEASQAVRLGRALGRTLLRPFGALHAKARRDPRSKARVYALESR